MTEITIDVFIIYSFTVIHDDGISSEVKYNIKFKSTKIIKFYFHSCFFVLKVSKVASFIIFWHLVILMFILNKYCTLSVKS